MTEFPSIFFVIKFPFKGDTSNTQGTQTVPTEEKDYSALFDTPASVGSIDLDDELSKSSEMRRKRTLSMYGSPSHGTWPDTPIYFGLAQVSNGYVTLVYQIKPVVGSSVFSPRQNTLNSLITPEAVPGCR